MGESVTEASPLHENDSPVASAITRRILLQRHDLLSQFGPQKVMAAIDDVADFVGDVEEIGSSDVSAWVKQVEEMLSDDLPGDASDDMAQDVEGDLDEASLAQMRDYFNQADSDSVKVDRNYDAPSKKQNPVGVPPEIQALVNKMYHAGKISPQEFEILRKFQQQTKINVGIREADKNPYAIGMAQAMKSTGDKPPLKKSTINKAHEIARAVKKGE
jgi:hypothetical protein